MRPVFSDYLSVSFDYGYNNALAEFGDIVDDTSVYFKSTVFWFGPMVAISK